MQDENQAYLDESPVISLTVGEFKNLVAQATRSDEEIDVEIGRKWAGGELVLRPGDGELQEKTIPIETFFHKIVMIRDRLRVLEQKVNSNKQLSDGDKVELQQYVTRIYGSLTTFNVLFQHRDDFFSGEGN